MWNIYRLRVHVSDTQNMNGQIVHVCIYSVIGLNLIEKFFIYIYYIYRCVHVCVCVEHHNKFAIEI